MYYKDETIKFEGSKFIPVTDVIHKEGNGFTNIVEDEKGTEYKAYYNKDHYKNDDWSNPLKVVKIQEGN